MNYLILYTAFNTKEYVEDSLTPFLKNPNCDVVASSRPFSIFNEGRKDNTSELIKMVGAKYHDSFLGIDDSDDIVDREHMAKNAALEVAAKNSKRNYDFLWIVDSDEFYTEEEIENIIRFVEFEDYKSTVTFKIALKNFVFDKETYLVQPFEPPRIFRTSMSLDWTIPPGHFWLHNFYWDNDVCYGQLQEDQRKIALFKWDQFPTTHIPKHVAWVKHLTWLNNERSKKKVEYQNRHFGNCGYSWGDNGLEFNMNYHVKEPETKKVDE